jgi:hypothetical protein
MSNVFVSSTFKDLQSHRVTVREGIRQLGAVDVSMENLGARDERPKNECLRLVTEESEIFVGIYAHRYGFVPDGDEISITQSEYEAATLSGLPRFIYVVDDQHPWPPLLVDHGPAKKRLDKFKKHLFANHLCEKFTTEDNLNGSVVADLGRHIAMRSANRVGPGLELPDIGIESLRGPATETPDGWNAHRNGIYQDSRGVFIAHVIEPSAKPNQEFDIFIYLVRHGDSDLSDIRFAEFFFGKYWENRIFPAVLNNGFIGVKTSAYGTFLCVCKVTFQDGKVILIDRYIDFESARHGK